MPPQTLQPNPPQQSTGQLLNTQPAPQMAPDPNAVSLTLPTQSKANNAMTNLGFANTMLHHLIKHKAGKRAKASSETSKQAPTPPEESKNAPQPTETPNTQVSTPSQNDTTNSDLEGKIKELETNHEKEITFLKSQISEDKLKNTYESKIADLEKKHTDEIKGIRDEVKTILNG